MKEIKHAGCKLCESKDQEILTSVALKGQGITGFALCDKCLKEQKDKNNIVGK